MKIISKHKDYYDHISHMYGEDPLKVLDRTVKSVCTYNNGWVLHFCDKVLRIYDKDHFHHDNMYDRVKYWMDKKWSWIGDRLLYDGEDGRIYDITGNHDYKREESFPYYYHRCPDFIPILSEAFFPKIYTPEDCYLMIEEFISKKDIEMNLDPTDMNRYEGKGFDEKINFRHR